MAKTKYLVQVHIEKFTDVIVHANNEKEAIKLASEKQLGKTIKKSMIEKTETRVIDYNPL